MSVYAELVRMGMNEKEAVKVSESVIIHEGLVTKNDLILTSKDLIIAMKEIESSLLWKLGTLIVTALLGATAIFATVVNIVLK